MLDSAHENLLTIHDIRPVLAHIHRVRMCIDPQYRGECKRLFENAGVRINYFGRDALTVDALAESLFDAGFTIRRLTCRELLDLLEALFAPRPRVKKGRKRGRKVVDAAVRKARDMRQRKYVCEACSQIARGTRSTSLICGICYEMDGVVRFMTRVDPLPEEVLETLAHGADEEVAA